MSLSKTLILCLVLVQHRKRPNVTEKNVDWDVNHQLKQQKNKVFILFFLFFPAPLQISHSSTWDTDEL